MTTTRAFADLSPWLVTVELRRLMLLPIGWRGEPERDHQAVEDAIDSYARVQNFVAFGPLSAVISWE